MFMCTFSHTDIHIKGITVCRGL
uniref:Uncharacterized protein n=1 Tax=Anguilla anguilla TaxID=7936 RepID=A0A0E9Q8G2_ANGAN